MNITKKCRHGRGLLGAKRLKVWRGCECAWVASVTVNGVRGYVNLGSDETTARAAALRLHADNIQGRVTRTRPGRTFHAAADSYLAEQAASPKARPNTIRTKTSRIENVKMYWGETPVDGITREHIQRFLDRLQATYAPNTALNLYATFRTVMVHAQRHGLIQTIPLPENSGIDKVNVREANHLTVDEVARVIAALPDPYSRMAELSVVTGLRIGEIAALTASDYDKESLVLQVRGTLHHDGTIGPPKTRHGLRAVPLSPRATEILDAAPEAGRLFPVPSLSMCGFVMREALKATGLYRKGRGWHACRHLHETILNASGLGIRESAARMGHGPNFVQTAAYGWNAETGDATLVDATRVRLHRGATFPAD